MERRSTADSYVHYLGDVTSNVDSSHGVTLRGGSTGGIIETIADDTNASLTVRAKNTGLLTLGNSSNRMAIIASTITSTAAWNFSGSSLRITASSVVIAPNSTGRITLGNSSNVVEVPTPFTATGSSFSVVGASSIVLSPTSTAGIRIGNSSNNNPIMLSGSTISIAGTSLTVSVTAGFTGGFRSSVGLFEINSSLIILDSTAMRVGSGSTTGINLIQRYAIDFTPPELASAAAAWTTYTVTGLTTNSALFISPHLTFSSQYVFSGARCSTINELSVLWTNQLASSIGTGESTNQWRVIQVQVSP